MGSTTLQKSFLLLSCTFLGLICGTLYLYSSFSPQLAKHLNYSVSDSSQIALIGTIGMATAGPAAGRVVDKTGYALLFVCGGLAIVLGYWGLKMQYDTAYSNVRLSAFLLFLVGLGSTFASLPNIKCCAVTFPRIKGLATSMPLAMFGLSAMFFSTVASIFYPGNTSGFLGCISMTSLAIFVLCAPSIVSNDLRRRHNLSPPVSTLSQSVSHSSSMSSHNRLENLVAGPVDKTKKPLTSKTTEYLHQEELIHENLTGKQLLHNRVFWILCLITGLLASTGQMYIYSVGYISKALITRTVYESLDSSISLQTALVSLDKAIQSNQQLQVGTLSVANSLGRVIAGILSDIMVKTFKMTRKLVLFLSCAGMMVALLLSINMHNPDRLVLNSLVMGLSYGLLYGAMPVIVGETFGMENFSSNWGLVSTAPVIPSTWLTTAFGNIFDSNSQSTPSSIANEKFTVCILGSQCYASAFRLTFLVALLALATLCYLIFSTGSKHSSSDQSHQPYIELTSIRAESRSGAN